MTPHTSAKKQRFAGSWRSRRRDPRTEEVSSDSGRWGEKPVLSWRDRLDADDFLWGSARRPNRLPEDPPNVYGLFEL